TSRALLPGGLDVRAGCGADWLPPGHGLVPALAGTRAVATEPHPQGRGAARGMARWGVDADRVGGPAGNAVRCNGPGIIDLFGATGDRGHVGLGPGDPTG